jgi:hypothetical protein
VALPGRRLRRRRRLDRAPPSTTPRGAKAPAELGYGDGDEATVVGFGPDENDKHRTTYFRRRFNVSRPSELATASLLLHRDDGAIVYLNGVEIFRSNMPAGPVDFQTLASLALDNGEADIEAVAPPSAFAEGENVLAVEIHQQAPDSSDISFDLELRATRLLPLVDFGADWRYLDNGSNQGTAWRATAFNDASWSEGPAELGYGDGDEATVVEFGPNPNNKFIATYFRRQIAVAGAAALRKAKVHLRRDDGAVVYVNGTEVFRSNMPTGTIGFQTLASLAIRDGATVWPETIPASAFVEGTNAIAVEIHQQDFDSSDISFDLSLSAQTEGLDLGPYLQMTTRDGATVKWRTLTPETGRLLWGSEPGAFENREEEPSARVVHELRATGLQPAARYYYAIAGENGILAGGDAEHYFDTHPEPGPAAPTRLWVIGDSGTGFQLQRDVRDAYLARAASEQRRADLWLLLGDNAYIVGSDEDFRERFFEIYAGIMRNTASWPVMGNHEASSSDSPTQSGPHYEIFTLPKQGEAGGVPSNTEAYYSFDYGAARFIALDSHDTSRATNGAMMNWLRADLADAAARGREWIVVFWHHPPYTKGSHDSDVASDSGGRMRDMREIALPIIEAAGADLQLAGHSHSYERTPLLHGHYGTSNTYNPATMAIDSGDGDPNGDGAYVKPPGIAPDSGTVYVVAGGSGEIKGGALNHAAAAVSLNVGGSLIIDIDGSRLDARYIDDAGAERDRFVIDKTEPGVGQFYVVY